MEENLKYINELRVLIDFSLKNLESEEALDEVEDKLWEYLNYTFSEKEITEIDQITDLLSNKQTNLVIKTRIAFDANQKEKSLKFLSIALESLIKSFNGSQNEINSFLDFYISQGLASWPDQYEKTSIDILFSKINNETEPAISYMIQAYNFKINDQMESAVDLFAKVIYLEENCFHAHFELAEYYYSRSQWENAIYYYEKSLVKKDEQEIRNYNYPYVYFQLGWANAHIKKHSESEKYYQKCLESDNDFEHAKNNLGYELFKQGKVEKALKVFNECIIEKRDNEFPFFNKIRCLVKLNRNEEALEVLELLNKTSKKKKQIKALEESITKRITKNKSLSQQDNSDEILNTIDKINTVVELKIDKKIFSAKRDKVDIFPNSEKRLEDFIIERIQSGTILFERKLRLFSGGKPGRQFATPIGRIDILAEDIETNDLVIIELKATKSEDEIFGQISRYVGWIHENIAKPNQKTFGIICAPEITEKLKYAVSNHPMINACTFNISTTFI